MMNPFGPQAPQFLPPLDVEVQDADRTLDDMVNSLDRAGVFFALGRIAKDGDAQWEAVAGKIRATGETPREALRRFAAQFMVRVRQDGTSAIQTHEACAAMETALVERMPELAGARVVEPPAEEPEATPAE